MNSTLLLIITIASTAFFYSLLDKLDKKLNGSKSADKDTGADNNSKKDKISNDYNDDDLIFLCSKLIAFTAKYCGIDRLNNDSLYKLHVFYYNHDASNIQSRKLELNLLFDFVNEREVVYSDIISLCKEIANRTGSLNYEIRKELLDMLFSTVYQTKTHNTILDNISSNLYIRKDSFNAIKNEYEEILNKTSSNKQEQNSSNKSKSKNKNKKSADSDNQRSDSQDYSNNRSLFDLTLELLVEAMKVDRSKMVCELDVIKYYILENDKEHFQERVADVKKYLSYEYIDLNVEEICDKINKELRQDYRKREDILRMVVELIYADETCTNVELNFLNKVAERLKVSKSSFDFIRMKFENRKNKSRQNKSSQNKSKKNSGSHNKQQSNSQNNNSQNNNSQDNNSQDDSQPKYSSELEKAYAALGIDKDATDKELSACWRNLMRVNHPDLMESRGPEAVRKATERCQEINKAFEIVKASRGMR